MPSFDINEFSLAPMEEHIHERPWTEIVLWLGCSFSSMLYQLTPLQLDKYFCFTQVYVFIFFFPYNPIFFSFSSFPYFAFAGPYTCYTISLQLSYPEISHKSPSNLDNLYTVEQTRDCIYRDFKCLYPNH